MADKPIDYDDNEYVGAQKMQYLGGGAISALADNEMGGEDDEYDDLYNDVNIGEGFLQLHRSEALHAPEHVGHGGNQPLTSNISEFKVEAGGLKELGIPDVSAERKYHNAGSNFPVKKEGLMDLGSQKESMVEVTLETLNKNTGFRGSSSMMPNLGNDLFDVNGRISNDSATILRSGIGTPLGSTQPPYSHQVVDGNQVRPPAENVSTMLYVGELHWWTTDAELESVLLQYGRVKEIKFFEERASGKSKGYCQVEFYDPEAAAACKAGMSGHVFNGQACVVAYASPQTLKQMGASYMNKSQIQSQYQGRRNMNEGVGRGGNMNCQEGDLARNYGRGGWGRGGQASFSRSHGNGGPLRRRGGGMGLKNMVGSNAANVPSVGGGVYGQGLGGAAFGGMINPQGVMGSGFDPMYMGRRGYGGFPGPSYPGMFPSFPAFNAMGLAGVAPHLNPSFFVRGMLSNSMGMTGSNGMDMHQAGNWNDSSMGGWGEEHDRRTRESSYGGDNASEYGFTEENNKKGPRSSASSREKEQGFEHDRSGMSNRRHFEEREEEWDQSERVHREHRYKVEKDSY